MAYGIGYGIGSVDPRLAAGVQGMPGYNTGMNPTGQHSGGFPTNFNFNTDDDFRKRLYEAMANNTLAQQYVEADQGPPGSFGDVGRNRKPEPFPTYGSLFNIKPGSYNPYIFRA